MKPEAMKTFKYLEPRLRRIEILAPLSFQHLADWFNYHWTHNTVFHVENRGVCVVKLFSRLEDFFEDYVHDPSGPFVAVEAASCETGHVLYELYEQFVNRWGPRPVVLWDRGPKKTTVCPRMYSWRQYEKLVRRMKNE
jgi:hypothetical protein